MSVKPTFEALVFLADQIFNRDLDVFESNIGRSAAPNTLAIHLPRADAFAALNEKEAYAIHSRSTGADSRGKVVAPDTVGDPFLFTIDDVVLAIFRQLSLTCQIRDIASCIWFGDGQADPLVAGQNSGKYTLHHLLLAVFDKRGTSNAETSHQIPDQAATSRP